MSDMVAVDFRCDFRGRFSMLSFGVDFRCLFSVFGVNCRCRLALEVGRFVSIIGVWIFGVCIIVAVVFGCRFSMLSSHVDFRCLFSMFGVNFRCRFALEVGRFVSIIGV